MNFKQCVLLTLGMACLPATSMASEEDAHKEPVGRDITIYEIQEGDSLWRIAGRLFGDATKWPLIWEFNQKVENPDFILAGDQLLLRIPDSIQLATPDSNSARSADNLAENLSAGESAVPGIDDKAATRKRRNFEIKEVPSRLEQAILRRQKQARPAYTDQLIDPEHPEDTGFADLYTVRERHWWNAADHSLQAFTLYRDDDRYFNSSVDYGIQYIARAHNGNWGQLSLDVIALDEYSDYLGPNGLNNNIYRRNSGLARITLDQRALPITEELFMDNTLGHHRQVRYNPFRDRPNLINYRFGAAEPDILGLSSHLYKGHSGISFSVGELGRTSGSVLPGFHETEGDVQRIQATHTLARHAFSLEYWNTEDQISIDNRDGYRFAYDVLLGSSTVASFSAVGSGGNNALLLGGSTHTDLSKHDYGLYYFDDDIIWIDTRLGDDNAGAFYRYHAQRGAYNWGTSLELRRDGLKDSSLRKLDTAYASFNVSRRLDRDSNLSGVYSYRLNKNRDGNRNNADEHSVRSYYTRNHRNNSRSNAGLRFRTGESGQEADIEYGWMKDLASDSSIELSANYRRSFGDNFDSNDLTLRGAWNKQFLSQTFIGLGLGYTLGTSDRDDNQGWTGYLNLEQTLTRNLALSLQVDYSYHETDFEYENDFSGTLFTGFQFDDELFSETRELTALLSLRYQFAGIGGPNILANRNARSGSGGIRGYLFLDKNNDGRRQSSEPGIEGMTLFLNSVYPVVTGSRGEYYFPNVGLGEHFIFIDETTLPLPWTLSGSEYTSLLVELRKTTRVDIPVNPVTLADVDIEDGTGE